MNIFRRTSSILLAGAALGAASLASAATPGGPQIAYAQQSGSAYSIYLTSPAGGTPVKLYTGAAKAVIGHIDMRPGGNELAFREGSGSRGVLKIVTYSDAGARTSLASLPTEGCTITGFDYHPSGDGSLIVARSCGTAQTLEIRTFANGAYASSPIVTLGSGNDSGMLDVRWLGDGSGFLLAITDMATGARIQRHELSNPSAPVTLWSTAEFSAIPSWFDVARCAGTLDSSCSKFLYTDGSGNTHQVHFDDFGGTDDGVVVVGSDGHYSPDNSHILYRLSSRNSQQLKIDSQVLVSKGTFAGKDWRP